MKNSEIFRTITSNSSLFIRLKYSGYLIIFTLKATDTQDFEKKIYVHVVRKQKLTGIDIAISERRLTD